MVFFSDFHKIGGFDIFPLCLDSDEPEIRWQCLELVASLVQNNPYCQTAVLQASLMPTVLHMLDTDSDPTVKTKALYAVSCKFVFPYVHVLLNICITGMLFCN